MNIKEKIQQYKEKRNIIIEEQRNNVKELIEKKWTKAEIDLYNMQYNTYAVPYGTNYQMSEFDIKLMYLKSNKSLFTKEEQEQLLLICTSNYNTIQNKSR